MKKRVVLVVSLLGIVVLTIYTRNRYQMVGPKMAVLEPSTKSDVVHMSQKVIQITPKLALIPKENDKPGNLGATYKPINEKIQPVLEADWSALEEMPTHKQPKDVLQSDWWKASAFIEIDFRKRPKDYKCRKTKNVGNWYLCQDEPYNLQKPCLVYSFGIANDFSFDDAMAKLGCEVHSFDPSMNKSEHVRTTNVTFHPIGLSNRVIKKFNPRHDIYVTNDQTWNMMDLLSIMEKLGHKNRVLDYLKIDVEGHEWSVIDYLLHTGITSRIRHFSLEYHIFPDWPDKAMYPDLLRTYKRLKEAGFYKYFTGLHPLDHRPKHFNIQADVCYVNIKYKE